MAMSRSFGGTWLTTRLLIRISPPVMFSSPAIMRKSVDFPQPEGPTRMTNSPSSMSIDTPWITGVAPKLLVTSLISTDAICAESPFLFEPPATASRQALKIEEQRPGADAGRSARTTGLPSSPRGRSRASALAAFFIGGHHRRSPTRDQAFLPRPGDHEAVREDIQP